jgi:hypothetical protein
MVTVRVSGQPYNEEQENDTSSNYPPTGAALLESVEDHRARRDGPHTTSPLVQY